MIPSIVYQVLFCDKILNIKYVMNIKILSYIGIRPVFQILLTASTALSVNLVIFSGFEA